MDPIDSDLELVQEALFEPFGSRVAAVGAFYGDDNEPRHFFTAHFFEFNEQWALVTAGHCLKGLIEDRDNGEEPGQILVFDPNSPTGAPLPIRLPFDSMIAIDNETTRADYGFVPIADMYKQELSRSGMTPCTVQTVAPASESFEIYYLFGNAWEHARFDVRTDSVGIQTPRTALRLTRLGNELSATASVDENPIFPRLQFKCNLEPIDGVPDLNDIGGMSGGLVIGLRRNKAGAAEAGLIGIQSAWLSGLQLLKVCPHDAFFHALRSAVLKN